MLILVALLIGGISACAPWAIAFALDRDAPYPPRVANAVELGKRSIASNIDGIGPLHLRFVRALCREDGGYLLVYEMHGVRVANFSVARLIGAPFGPRYAWAARGPEAVVPADAWGFSGGIGVDDIDADHEVRHYFSESPRSPCP